jgi:tetratricopeptide (TPR) repeat protein
MEPGKVKGLKGLKLTTVVAAVGLLAVAGGLTAAAIGYVLRVQGERQYLQLLATGEQALSHGNLYGAIEAFSGALVLRPNSMVAFYRRGEAYRAQNQELEAVANFRQANRLAPDAIEPLIALGDLYDTKGDFGQAALWYGQAADRLKDEDPSLLYRLALARYRAGAPALAIEPLKRAIARNDLFAPAHYLLGLVHRDARNLDAARVSIEQAVRIDPAFTAAREELADLYRAEGRAVDEIQQLQALAARDAQVARKTAIALAEARYGQYDGAIGTLTDALAAAPSDPRVQIALARVYLGRAEHTRDRDSLNRAIGMLERALGGSARRSEGLALYGRAIYLSGDLPGAERLLREAVATSPVDLEAFRSLAEVAERLSHDVIARDALVNLDTLEGDTAPANVRASRARRIGDLSLRAGDARTAASYLGQAVDAGVRDSSTLGQLARARWLSGDADGARATLAQALELAPRDVELQRIARMIR